MIIAHNGGHYNHLLCAFQAFCATRDVTSQCCICTMTMSKRICVISKINKTRKTPLMPIRSNKGRCVRVTDTQEHYFKASNFSCVAESTAAEPSVSRPSSVSNGVSSTDFIVTAILAQDAMAFLPRRGMYGNHHPVSRWSPPSSR